VPLPAVVAVAVLVMAVFAVVAVPVLTVVIVVVLLLAVLLLVVLVAAFRAATLKPTNALRNICLCMWAAFRNQHCAWQCLRLWQCRC
jgi:hypothetical protein